MRDRILAFFSCLLLFHWFSLPHPGLAGEWIPVKGGKLYGISGMALFHQDKKVISLLIVHDNKKKNQTRLAVISLDKAGYPPLYQPISWPDHVELPVDLEGLVSLPGPPHQTFLALASDGHVYHLHIVESQKRAEVLHVFQVPEVSEHANFEALGIQPLNEGFLIVWADRGKDTRPSSLFWGVLDLARYQISGVHKIEIRVPWPLRSEVRHISDLKINSNGVLIISSASDPGDDGPFQSAIYLAGVFGISADGVNFHQNPKLTRILNMDFKKVEALELVPGEWGGLMLGTDDENFGSSLFFSSP